MEAGGSLKEKKKNLHLIYPQFELKSCEVHFYLILLKIYLIHWKCFIFQATAEQRRKGAQSWKIFKQKNEIICIELTNILN